MKKPRMRGSAPGRARAAHQRPGTFEHGHRKVGGRTPGTPNAFSADYKKAIIEAAHRIGFDGNGKFGIVGYFIWIAIDHTPTFGFLLGHVLALQALETCMPQEPLPSVEQLNQRVEDYIASGRGNLKREDCAQVQSKAASSADWTGQPFPLSSLMHIAVAKPTEFAKLLAAAFLCAYGKRRRLASPQW